MTTQEAFTSMVRHLRKQGVQSLDGKGDCAYRGLNGLQCAVGCLIPDSEYDGLMENRRVHDLVERGLISGLSEVNLELLTDVQLLHDFEEPELWEGGFRHIAARYSLEIPA